MTDVFIPPAAQPFVDKLAARNLPCRVVPGPRKVTLVCDVGRVHATAEFRYRHGGWYQADSVLTIDGVRCESAHNFDELARIIADPDAHKEGRTLLQQLDRLLPNGLDFCPTPPKPVEEVDLDIADVPNQVRHHLDALGAVVAKHPNLVIRVERPEPDRWQVRLWMPDNDQYPNFVIVFDPKGAGWRVRYIALTVPGCMESINLGNSVPQALNHLGGLKTEEPPKIMGAPRSAPRTGNDHIRAKVNTVIRT